VFDASEVSRFKDRSRDHAGLAGKVVMAEIRKNEDNRQAQRGMSIFSGLMFIPVPRRIVIFFGLVRL
jgi:hypothetical protein